MIQSVHSVMIGKKCPASYTTVDALAKGDVALFDENKALIKTAAEAAEASSLYVGVVEGSTSVVLPDGTGKDMNIIEFSNEIQKSSKPSAVIGEWDQPTLAQAAITLTDAKITAGNRYVLRILYKDVYAPGQFTHTYEVIAESADTAALATAFATKINKHKNRRVNAGADASAFVIQAMDKDDNEGVNSINEFSMVSMEVSLYETTPSALLSNQPKAVAGAEIEVFDCYPGKGFWKQVRDQEARNMGYKGHVFTGAYPSVEQDRKVVEDTQYDYATIECDNLYLSNDNQYIKTTPLTIELYVPGLKNSIVDKGIQSFIAGKEVGAGA